MNMVRDTFKVEAGSNDLIKTLVHFDGVHILLVDPIGPKGAITYCSESFLNKFGFVEEDVMGSCLLFMKGPGTSVEAAQRIRIAIAQQQSLLEELLLYDAAGKPVWCCVWITPIFSREKNATYLVANIIDISQKKALEQDSLHTDRLRALGLLAASIGHDFNNIIHTVGYSIESAMRSNLGPRQKRDLERISWGCDQLQTLCQQMLSLARKQNNKRDVINLNQVINGFDRMIMQSVKSGVQVDFLLEGKELAIKADKAQLELAVLNLVRNASDAIPKHGTVTLHTSLIGRMVELAVSDTGSGMSSDVLARATEPFFTTKDSKGTGLGLPMVSGFMIQCGGSMKIESTVGQGTTIRLQFSLYT